MIKITIIIPTYNMEKYIEKCMDSIIKQSLKEIEIICIDDGSTDKTEKIIRKFQKDYANILYKKQINQGAGIARNLGIMCAKGKYIAFMDADDFYPDSDSLKYLYDAAEAHEVSICGGSRCICHENVVTVQGVRKELLFLDEGMLRTRDFDGAYGFQQFIFNRNFINQHHLRFPDYRRCQDLPFFVNALSFADEMYVCKIYSYCYRKEHKVVVFTERKAVDYLKGMRDALKTTNKHDMRMMYTCILNDFFGETSAILYKYIADGNREMLAISREIREFLDPRKIVQSKFLHKSAELLVESRIYEYAAEMKANWEHFSNEIKEQKILIFGAGTLGRKVLRLFKEKDILVEAFTVSDVSQNVEEIDGIHVRNIDDFCDTADEYFIVVAVYGYLQKEIDLLLEKKGFEKRRWINIEELCLYEEQITH